MKTKKNKRKLALNKMSIARLDKIEIHEVKGGIVIFNGFIKNISDVCSTQHPPSICSEYIERCVKVKNQFKLKLDVM